MEQRLARRAALPLAAVCAAAACAPASRAEPDPPLLARGDLEEIRQRGVLRLLVPSGDPELLPRDVSPAEEEQALSERFARSLELRPERVVVEDRSRLLDMLVQGRGDVAVAQLTVTETRARRVAFTRATTTVDEWLVGRRGAPDLPRTLEALAGRAVHVRPSSSYAETLEELAAELEPPPRLVAVDESLDTEGVLYEVGRGRRPLTVADGNLLEAVEDYNPDIERLVRLARDRVIAWAVRRDNPALRAAADAFLMGDLVTAHSREPSVGDLPAIRERGSLRVLTLNSPLHYYLHRGRRQGFDYELSRMAARELGLRLDVIVAPRRAALVPWLLEGRGDVIAAGLVAGEAPDGVATTRPYLISSEVLAQREGDRPLDGVADLEGREIHVRPGSSHERTLRALIESSGPFRIVPTGDDGDEALLDRVAAGVVPLAAVDARLVGAGRSAGVPVQVALELPEPGGGAAVRRIAFGVRESNPELLAFLDGFVRRRYRGLEYNLAWRRAFENPETTREARLERTSRTGRLSPWDEMMRRLSAPYGLDWRLMVAVAQQESRWDPEARSHAGAVGLFQLMPRTARALGHTDLEDPEVSARAAVEHMAGLLERLETRIPLKHRVRLALAAWNAGWGHLADARRLAAEQGWSRDKWFGHVEQAMALLEQPRYYNRARYGYVRARETIRFVSEIQLRYDHYVSLLPP